MMQATARRYAESRRILAIDPGPERSAWIYLDQGEIRHPSNFGIDANDDLIHKMAGWGAAVDVYVIEKIEGFGMAVGAEVFETVYWSGRFAQSVYPLPVDRVGRRSIKVHLCGTAKAKDQNVRQALIDRFGGPAAIRKGGALYGVSKDVWSALALAVTYADGVR